MLQRVRRMFLRSPEFLAAALLGSTLLLITLGGAGLIYAQVFLGPKRDFVALATSASGQRVVSVDSTTTPARLEVGRDTVNGLLFSGGATGTTPLISAAVSGADSAAGLTLNPGTTGYTTIGGNHTSGIAFFPATTYCKGDTTNLTPTRTAANDWSMARTATGAETINITCDLNLNMTRSTLTKGIRIDAIRIAYGILVTNLTSHAAPTLRRTTYANATANSIDSTGLTLSGTLSTTSVAAATAYTPYLTGLTISSAAFQTTTNTSFNLDWQAVLANTGIYRLIGVAVDYTHALY